ncbi:hypothetical protein EUX98_g5704 [Antrodiella citrinella]|uniref:Polyketide synthase phosphopantetheine-binding domain-containing protein n=1 Tax=Antrodiella citrinella TaxID=2447956 RepID=A0A4S4MQY8_9APHY|nr:hypothetical protein EUX98_g5704 [Antrodiella citrinella]
MSALASAVQALMEEKHVPIKTFHVPELHTIFPSLRGGDATPEELYPPASARTQLDDVVMYLHSSGSTGSPKPIPQTNRTILEWIHSPSIYLCRERDIRIAVPALPTFHTMGIMMQFYFPLASGRHVGVYAPQAPHPPVVPTPQNILDTCKATDCNAIVIIPSIIEVWAQSRADVEYLATLESIAFAGGPLSDTNGVKLTAAGVKLFSVYGATECGVPTGLFDADDSQGPDADVKTSAEWSWMKFVDYVNIRWIPQGDGSYELQFLTCSTHHPAIENLPDTRGYSTSDLWEPHPKKKGIWRIVGRADDVIVLGSAEKIVPIPQEGYLTSIPFVNGAIMFGRGQTQAGVLVEPRPDAAIDPKNERALVNFRNKIWPYVEEANTLAPSFARIFKEMILVSDPAKPFARAAKGTPMRKLICREYEEEIDQLYETIEASTSSNGTDPPSSWSVEAVEDWLVKHATTINKGQEPVATVDIFDQGFDSLSATFLRNRIIGALRSSSDASAREAAIHVSQEFVFMHSTLQRLAAAVVHLVYPQQVPEGTKSGKDEILDLIVKFSADMPHFKGGQIDMSEPAAVLLTGSTGSLGSHILAALLASPKVKRVFTLDRPGSASALVRLQSSFESRGLSGDLLQSEKLVTLSGTLAQDALGLNAEAIQEIRSSVTHIIHNAWKLDFNLSVSSFQSHIAGARALLDISASFANPVKLLFSSSIAAAQAWNLADGSVPEEVLPDAAVAVGTGYGSSKYVTERLLAKARENGLETISFRIGQLSGSTTTGAWNITDWVPIIVKSSITLGYLPDINGLVDWTPLDIAAQTVVDAVESPEPLPTLVNIVHPRPTRWSDVFAAVNTTLGGHLHVVPFSKWLSKVEAHSANATEHDFDTVPAIKLLRFFRAIDAASIANPEAPLLLAEHSETD